MPNNDQHCADHRLEHKYLLFLQNILNQSWYYENQENEDEDEV